MDKREIFYEAQLASIRRLADMLEIYSRKDGHPKKSQVDQCMILIDALKDIKIHIRLQEEGSID